MLKRMSDCHLHALPAFSLAGLRPARRISCTLGAYDEPGTCSRAPKRAEHAHKVRDEAAHYSTPAYPSSIIAATATIPPVMYRISRRVFHSWKASSDRA